MPSHESKFVPALDSAMTEKAKRAIDGAYARERDAGLAWEAQQAAGPLLSEDRKAGLRAAAERTRADFKGN
jgi:hypothetical protein